MRTIAHALALAALTAAGCATTIGPRGARDGPQPVSLTLHLAVGPAIDRAVTGADWAPEFLDRTSNGRDRQVLGRETVEQKYVYVFRCVRATADGPEGKAHSLPPADGKRIVAALGWDLHAIVTRSDCDVTHHRVTDSAIEIDYRRGESTGTVRALLGPESVPEGHAPDCTRIEVEVREKTTGRLRVVVSSPLLSLLGRALD